MSAPSTRRWTQAAQADVALRKAARGEARRDDRPGWPYLYGWTCVRYYDADRWSLIEADRDNMCDARSIRRLMAGVRAFQPGAGAAPPSAPVLRCRAESIDDRLIVASRGRQFLSTSRV